jgi:hypothetical protein
VVPAGDETEATPGWSVPDSHKVHPWVFVRGRVPRALWQRMLRGGGGLRRCTDGTPGAEYQALQMEEDTAIDTELRGLQFG